MTETNAQQAEKVAVVNPPAASKINLTSGASLMLAIAASAGFVIPPQWRELTMQIISIATPIIVMILRTWFTNRVASTNVLQKAIQIKVAEQAKGNL